MTRYVALLSLMIPPAAALADSPPPPRSRAVRGAPLLPITSNEYGFDPRAPQAVRVGETAPDFTVPSAAGGPVTLSVLAKRGQVVLVIYRGQW